MIADWRTEGTPTFTDMLRSEVARMQAMHPDRLGELSRAHAAIIEGHVVDTGDGNGKVLSRNGNTWYTTNGVCACKAAEHGQACRHLQAWKLYQHVARKWEAQYPSQGETPAAVPTPAGMDPRFVMHVHGKPFVRYAGLLALAHQRGLQSLRVSWTYNDADLSLAEATAVFPFGTYQEAGDASPSNVTQEIAPSFRRMALTRAAARVLRNALAIDACSVEELE